MRLVISKSTIKKDMENNKLDFYKKQLLAILDKKEKEEKKDINKSLEFIEKGNGLPPGTKKEWPAGSGKWYVKTGQGKWIRTYNNSSSRGAKQSIAYMRKRIQNAESLEDLLNFVQENKDKFTDENGKPIDIVKDLMKDVHAKHQDFKGAKKEASKAAEKVMNNNSESKEDEKKGTEKIPKMVLMRAVNALAMSSDNLDTSISKIEAALKDKPDSQELKARLLVANYLKKHNKEASEAQSAIENGSIYDTETKELNNLIKEKKDKWKAENEAKRPKQTFEDIKKNYQNAKSVQGNSKTIHIGNEKIKCHYKLVEAETPIASHDENTFQKTEGFPTNNGGTINDRDYENDNSAKEGVMRIAGNYDGRALEQPPIVTKDGIVVSGNNRTMSSKLAAKNGTDKEYIDELKDVIEDYGIDEEELSKFKNPRIILEIDKEHEGEYTTEEFAKYNKTDQKSKSTVEKAVEASKTIKPDTIQSLAEHISEFDTLGDLYNNKKAAREFVDALVTNGVIQPNDMAQYYTEQAGLSENGKEFIETTLVGGIMNENNIRSLSGAGGKSLRQKLVRAIVPLIDNKGIGKEYTFNDELNKAVNIVLEIQQGGKFTTVQEYMDQGNLFGDTVDPLTGRLAQLLHENTQKEFAEKMREVEGGLRPSANGEFDIFLGECETRDSILDRILKIKNKVSKALDFVFSLFE